MLLGRMYQEIAYLPTYLSRYLGRQFFDADVPMAPGARDLQTGLMSVADGWIGLA